MVGALGRLYSHPVGSLMTILVIGVALALPTMLQILVANGTALGSRWDNVLDMSVYMKVDTKLAQTEDLATAVERWKEVSLVNVISADEALESFRQQADFGDAIDALDENPLPHVLVVRPADNYSDGDAIADLKNRLESNNQVELVQSDSVWIMRFNTLLEIAKRSVASAFVLLALAVILIVGNTIRLDIENRRDEIVVTKLVGGSDAFIRRPFLYYGCWYGFAGGICAWGVMMGILWALNAPIQELAELYGSQFRLQPLSWRESLTLLGVGTFLGWLGAWFAAQRHMNLIEPQ